MTVRRDNYIKPRLAIWVSDVGNYLTDDLSCRLPVCGD
jgi:hypothetical protein